MTQILLGTAIVCFVAGTLLHRLGDSLWLPDLAGTALLLTGETIKFLGAFFVLFSTITAPWESAWTYLWERLWR